MLPSESFVKKLIHTVFTVFDIKKNEYSVIEKSKFDYVTDVDKSLEQAISQLIQKEYPNHKVIGEESIQGITNLDGPTWVIDPLDGTSNFLFGIPSYACSIAFVNDSKVQFGLVVDLVHREIFSARRGLGAFLDDKMLDTNSNRSDFIGISSGFLESADLSKPGLISQIKKIGKFRLLGSQALHLCYVAAGRMKACVNLEAKIWDDIAAALIIQEANGTYSSPSGFHPDSVISIDPSQNLFSIGEAGKEAEVEKLVRKPNKED